AREAEICYATVAMVTDYDCWHPGHDAVTVEMILKVLFANAAKAKALVKSIVPLLSAHAGPCWQGCRHALDHALITAPAARDTAAYGIALAMATDSSDGAIARAVEVLAATRPTAVNLHWALEAMRRALAAEPPLRRHEAALVRAAEIAEEDIAINRAIGEHGL